MLLTLFFVIYKGTVQFHLIITVNLQISPKFILKLCFKEVKDSVHILMLLTHDLKSEHRILSLNVMLCFNFF